MTKKELLTNLKSKISPEKLAMIQFGQLPHISTSNARTMLDLMAYDTDSADVRSVCVALWMK